MPLSHPRPLDGTNKTTQLHVTPGMCPAVSGAFCGSDVPGLLVRAGLEVSHSSALVRTGRPLVDYPAIHRLLPW